MAHFLSVKLINISIISSLFILMACGHTQKPETGHNYSAGLKIHHAGYDVYKKHCLSCHQSDGSGITGYFPPLGNSERVQKDEERLIKIILSGLSGEIEVNGVIYNTPMPPLNYLTDQQIADVLTYIRSDFKNNALPVSPVNVSRIRKSLSK
jgi:mono/diheme cytochrome c family protein